MVVEVAWSKLNKFLLLVTHPRFYKEIQQHHLGLFRISKQSYVFLYDVNEYNATKSLILHTTIINY